MKRKFPKEVVAKLKKAAPGAQFATASGLDGWLKEVFSGGPTSRPLTPPPTAPFPPEPPPAQ